MGNIAGAVGRGIVAGVAGTAALTLSEKIEQSFTKRQTSMVPAEVGAKVTGVEPESEADAAKLNWAVHWSHGVTMGAVRGLLGATSLSATTASVLHLPLVWGGDAALYATLGVAPAPWKWGGQELATDLWHKGVLSVVTSLTFIALD
jgi:hypothetical protein